MSRRHRVPLQDGPVVLVVPPFAWLDRPALGVHLLQAIGRRQGIDVRVLYANALFAAWFGERTYRSVSTLQLGMFLGERLFFRAAYGGPPLGRDGGANLEPTLAKLRTLSARRQVSFSLDLDGLLELEAQIEPWLEWFVAPTATMGYRVIGCSSSFEQNAASIAILRTFRRHVPDAVTILGGANCEGEMADGICALTDAVDWVFAGESERTFASFLEALRAGEPPAERIIRGEPCTDLDALPTPDFTDYYRQIRKALPHSAMARGDCNLSYETSRGCWWGQKSHCTFCGLNGQGMAMRAKTADRAIEELRHLLVSHPNNKVAITDNIMPHQYFRTLVPRLAEELPGIELMYEQKANLGLDRVRALMSAGITEIQPGIESLSTGLLKLMAKGTTAAQNIALLRFAAAVGMKLQWNLLFGFPGDQLSFYRETLELLPLLVHLPPPRRVNPVLLDRFSPYHSHPERYGISNLRPVAGYDDVVPEHVDTATVAYHFEGDFESGALEHPDLIAEIAVEVTRWRDAYHGRTPPRLSISRRPDGRFDLVDTRGLCDRVEVIDEARARTALVARAARSVDSRLRAWALDRQVAVERDGKLVALAVAEPELLAELLEQPRSPRLEVTA